MPLVAFSGALEVEFVFFGSATLILHVEPEIEIQQALQLAGNQVFPHKLQNRTFDF